MGKRKVPAKPLPAALPQKVGKRSAARPDGKQPASADKGKQEAKHIRRKTMQERAGLEISPARCKRIIAQSWRGGKISTEASVVLAAFLQYMTAALLSSADQLAGPDNKERSIGCGHLQAALDSMRWIRTSGIMRGHVVGAAAGEGDDAAEDARE